mmetsp:Transcript_3518/g.6572  ORF Transcript_3518/g.6572 Transcript_3518/m.6572 type:complete len:253 (+) Transcript_3518:1045-1803(+)
MVTPTGLSAALSAIVRRSATSVDGTLLRRDRRLVGLSAGGSGFLAFLVVEGGSERFDDFEVGADVSAIAILAIACSIMLVLMGSLPIMTSRKSTSKFCPIAAEVSLSTFLTKMALVFLSAALKAFWSSSSSENEPWNTPVALMRFVTTSWMYRTGGRERYFGSAGGFLMREPSRFWLSAIASSRDSGISTLRDWSCFIPSLGMTLVACSFILACTFASEAAFDASCLALSTFSSLFFCFRALSFSSFAALIA